MTAKLVRDNIPDIIRSEGREPIVSMVSGEGLTKALHDKFLEEWAEYLSAPTQNLKVEELADVLEVVFSLATGLGYSEQEVLKICQEKRAARGGFAQGYFYMGCK